MSLPPAEGPARTRSASPTLTECTLPEMIISSARISMHRLAYPLTLSRRCRRSSYSLFHRSGRKPDRRFCAWAADCLLAAAGAPNAGLCSALPDLSGRGAGWQRLCGRDRAPFRTARRSLPEPGVAECPSPPGWRLRRRDVDLWWSPGRSVEPAPHLLPARPRAVGGAVPTRPGLRRSLTARGLARSAGDRAREHLDVGGDAVPA